MSQRTLLVNARLISDGKIFEADVLIVNGRIERIDSNQASSPTDTVIDLKNHLLMPGLIDDQVHFREPGWEYKANIATESATAVAGGITSYMEMPNTLPPTDNLQALKDKYERARGRSWANYAFHFGATNNNAEVIAQLTEQDCPAIKVFMGASTGPLLVDDDQALDDIFRTAQLPVLTHCEDNDTIVRNLAELTRSKSTLSASDHPLIRSHEACLISSSKAVALARTHNTRLHVLHLTTAKELELFTSGDILDKRITAEVCVHHLFFCDEDYPRLGNLMVCNPAVKTSADRDALRAALNDDRIDIIATDHAPHTLEEKSQQYPDVPAGLPLAQHSLTVLMDLHKQGLISLERIVQKACHAPAQRFGLVDRGYLREGYWADMVVVDPNGTTAGDENLLSKCGWSPFVDHVFSSRIASTWVNGVCVWDGTKITAPTPVGERLIFKAS